MLFKNNVKEGNKQKPRLLSGTQLQRAFREFFKVKRRVVGVVNAFWENYMLNDLVDKEDGRIFVTQTIELNFTLYKN
jgi:hypothetical protein